MKMIVARNLKKSFGDKRVVDDLSLQVRTGEIYGLVGPDGAGKTTTIRMLCGAVLPDDGDVKVGGFSMVTDADRAREQLGYLSQTFSLYEEMTVLENLRFFAEVRGLSAHEWRPRTLEILDFVGLGEFLERRAGQLSGGMKQKLGLATALVHRPDVLLLDEPTGGVDPVTRQDFWKLIIELVAEEGISVLVSTPYMDEAVRCTYVGFLKDGRIILEDKPANLRRRLDGRILMLRGAPPDWVRRTASIDPHIENVQAFGNRFHLRIRREAEGKAVVNRLRRLSQVDGLDGVRVDEIQPQLEDVFISLLQEDDTGE